MDSIEKCIAASKKSSVQVSDNKQFIKDSLSDEISKSDIYNLNKSRFPNINIYIYIYISTTTNTYSSIYCICQQTTVPDIFSIDKISSKTILPRPSQVLDNLLIYLEVKKEQLKICFY